LQVAGCGLAVNLRIKILIDCEIVQKEQDVKHLIYPDTFPLLLKEGWPDHILIIIEIFIPAGVVDC
jgi:hypothetical protein